MNSVVHYEWVFQRRREQLIVQRWRRPDKVWELTLIWPSGETETEGYLEISALIEEHMRVERQLARSGWTLVAFRPERRRMQRRRMSRPHSASTDRRRLGRVTPLLKRR